MTGLSCSEKHLMKIRQKVPGFYFRIFCKEFYSDFQSYSKDYECDSVFSLVKVFSLTEKLALGKLFVALMCSNYRFLFHWQRCSTFLRKNSLLICSKYFVSVHPA